MPHNTHLSFTYLSWVQLGIAVLLLLTTFLNQVDWNVLNFLTIVESFES